MKRIINGKRYDTDTAKKVAYDCYNGSRRDFQWWQETLYRKNTGEFFLYGEGGAMTKYAEREGNSGWTGGERIMPLTYTEAQEWAEKHLDADEYEGIFGAVDEGEGKTVVTFSLPKSAIETLKRKAAKAGVPLSEHVTQLIME